VPPKTRCSCGRTALDRPFRFPSYSKGIETRRFCPKFLVGQPFLNPSRYESQKTFVGFALLDSNDLRSGVRILAITFGDGLPLGVQRPGWDRTI